MDAAKAAINKITSGHGHKTTVDEVVRPAVTQERVKPYRHEEFTQAVDREVHQDHYHTTVQPVSHKETLPEKHTHNLLPVEHKEIQHDSNDEAKAKASAELARFKDSSTVHRTKHTQEVAPTTVGEHVHHHVHETVVPVIQKETIQPEVVHTTVPVHETHHTASQHHGISALPTKTLDEFNRAGGSLAGSKEHAHEEYDGPPCQYNENLNTTFEKLGFASDKSSSSNAAASGTTGNSNRGTYTAKTAGVGGGASSRPGTTAITGRGGTSVNETRPRDSGIAVDGSSDSSARTTNGQTRR
ncbi:hypothetical protein DV736_g534, partial [Chaetothyriales sp. CBS 134916]